MRASESARQVPPSGIREIVNLVASRPPGSVLRLEVGEPDVPTSAHIVRAAVAAAESGVGYTQSAGTLELRAALSDRLRRVMDVEVPPERVVVTQGGVQGSGAVIWALAEPGDEVLVPDPGWPNFEMQVRLRGALPVRYPLRPAAGFVPDPDEVLALVTERTRLLVINSPGNPTGAVFPPDVVQALVMGAARRGVPVLSDEVYDELVFEGRPSRAMAVDPDAVVSLHSFSKTYAMTGWRVGYVAAPPWLAPVLATLQEPLVSCISGVSQAAALAAVLGPQDFVTTMRDTYRARRDLTVAALARHGLAVVRPQGAFYAMVGLAPGVDSRLAALDLLHDGVAVAPGSAFGDVAADHVRLSLASSEATLTAAVERIAAWAERTSVGAALGQA